MDQRKPAGNRQQQQEQEPLPGVSVGDEVYFRHARGPASGRVVCTGKDGCTLHFAGKPTPVKWEHVLAHKARAPLAFSIEEDGEDGMIVRDQGGNRRFIGIPPEAREDKLMVKSLGGHRLIHLTPMAKAMGAPPGPGLTQKKLTDKNGVQTTRWVSTRPDEVPQRGHYMGFKKPEGGLHHGKVTAVGKDGVVLRDKDDKPHRMLHRDLTHHWEGDDIPPHGPADQAPQAGAHPEVVETREFAGLPLNIEFKKGGTRTKTARTTGKTWSIEMQADYGEIAGTKGADGDPVDVFVGPNEKSRKVFVMNQVKRNGTTFDEHKVMLGFDDEETAKKTYMAHYPADWQGLKSVTRMNMNEFKEWIGGDVQAAPAKTPVVAHKGQAAHFKAAEFAGRHNDDAVTADDIVGEFGEDAKQRIADARQRADGVTQTVDEFSKDGTWDERRLAMHHEILFGTVNVGGKPVPGVFSKDRIKAATPAAGKKPVFIALGGRGGSGKSSLNGRVYDESKAVVLDADHIKGMLPEYQGWNAHQVHEESSQIIEAALELGKKLGLNIVLDATMKTGKSIEDKVDAFKAAGFAVEAHYMHLPRQDAARRAVGRFMRGGEKGRFVPPEVVLGNTQNEANFDRIKDKADAWSFHDNSGAQGEGPKLIASHGKPAMIDR